MKTFAAWTLLLVAAVAVPAVASPTPACPSEALCPVTLPAGLDDNPLPGAGAPPGPWDFDGDFWMSGSDLNIVLGHWGQNVDPFDKSQGDASGDGFVGGEELNFVLGYWGIVIDVFDFDGDGFYGGSDLNIVLGHWGQTVPAGDKLQGDGDGDGFVGGEDLNIVLGGWGWTPPFPTTPLIALPEPTGLAPLLSILAAPFFRRQRST